jgi:hypothetical protein
MTDTTTVDLAAWLTAIWDEEEEIALTAAGWDRSGRKRAGGQWVRSGISSVEDDERRSVIYSDSGQVSGSVADHVARHDPASVLARIAADRKILELHEGVPVWPDDQLHCFECSPDHSKHPCRTVRLLASPYKGREGWQEDWGDE